MAERPSRPILPGRARVGGIAKPTGGWPPKRMGRHQAREPTRQMAPAVPSNRGQGWLHWDRDRTSSSDDDHATPEQLALSQMKGSLLPE